MKKLILLIGIAWLHAATSYGVLTCRKCTEAHKKDGTKSPFSCHKLETMAKHFLLNHHTYLCCYCRRHFKGFGVYRTHMFDAHKRTACRHCIWRTFEKTEDYKLHEDASHVEYGWRCHVCRENVSTLERFVIHAAVHHRQYACRYCMRQNHVKKEIKGFKTKNDYLAHAIHDHGEFICMECNMRAFGSQKDYNEHCGSCAGGRKKQKIAVECKHCGCPKTFRCEAEKNLHDLQHAFLLFFLKETICGYECCIPFRKALFVKTTGKASGEAEKSKIEESEIRAVREFALHVSEKHKRCLFCENPVTKESAGILEGNLANLTYKQIRYDARMFIQLDANTFSKGEIPAIPCDMCGSALQPNRKSRLFFASIKELPFGKGLNIRDYPFHHLEYDEQKAKKNALLSVIKKVPANEEESCFIPKEEEKEDVILGEEDEEESEEEGVESDEEEKEEKKEDRKEEKKEEEKEPEPKTEK